MVAPPRILRPGTLALVFVALLVGASAVVLANHLQTANGKTVSFDHKEAGANEWWVEVTLGGTDAGTVSKVESMDTDGPWVTMAKQSWGDYGVSYHIEPGHLVRFRATWPDATQITSCWFTHPDGLEQCDSGGTTTPPPTWTRTDMGTLGPAAADVSSIGDADHDGKPEVYAVAAGILYQFVWTGSAWTDHQIPTASPVSGLVVGNAGDGTAAIYVGSNGTVARYAWTGSGFSGTTIAAVSGNPTRLTFGNLDGHVSLYAAVGHVDSPCSAGDEACCTCTTFVTEIAYAGGPWNEATIASLPGWPVTTWVGDGEGSGSPQLYVGTIIGGALGDIKWTGSAWATSQLPAGGTDAVVAGDAGDGHGAVYTLPDTGPGSQQNVYQSSLQNGVWTSTPIATLPGSDVPEHLFLGDADDSGHPELYVGSQQGALYQAKFANGWMLTQATQAPSSSDGQVVVGDGDGDGLREAYFSARSNCSSSGPCDGRMYQVATHAPPTTTTASFTGVRGNEWWVQTNVAPVPSSVDVRLNGGAWLALGHQSWGGWAASYHIVQGTIVQFRATTSSGTALSGCYQWIPPSNTDATAVSCSGGGGGGGTTTSSSSTTGTSTFKATFSGVQGNEWWVQASVSANQAIAGVDARVNCGTWQTLTKQSWGGWAASFHVPSGSKVDFRARSTTGTQSLSGGYIWPNATPTTGCP